MAYPTTAPAFAAGRKWGNWVGPMGTPNSPTYVRDWDKRLSPSDIGKGIRTWAGSSPLKATTSRKGYLTQRDSRSTFTVLQTRYAEIDLRSDTLQFDEVEKRIQDLDKYLKIALRKGTTEAIIATKKYVANHQNKGKPNAKSKYKKAKQKVAKALRLKDMDMGGALNVRMMVGGKGGIKGRGKGKKGGIFSMSMALDEGTWQHGPGSGKQVEYAQKDKLNAPVPWDNYFWTKAKRRRGFVRKRGSSNQVGGVIIPSGRAGFTGTTYKTGSGRRGYVLPFERTKTRKQTGGRRGRKKTMGSPTATFSYSYATKGGGTKTWRKRKKTFTQTSYRMARGSAKERQQRHDDRLSYMYRKSTAIDSMRIGGSEKRGYWPVPALRYMEYYAIMAQIATAAYLWKTVWSVLQGDRTLESAMQASNSLWNDNHLRRITGLSSKARSAYRGLI